MKTFNYYQPTEIRFGCGRVSEAGQAAAKYGKCCLLVTVKGVPCLEPVFEKVKSSLKAAGVDVAHFDGVVPNPTTESITAGAEVAKAHKADVILGVGGGSSMDTAKAVAVEATHKGACWDYLWFRQTQPTERTLPIITVTTTSGTGSQVTQVAVVTNTAERDKSAIYNSIIYPKVSIVDPELMLTVPKGVTACTGFDVFTHAFETFIHTAASPYTDMMAKEAIKLVAEFLPKVLMDEADIKARESMAWADTLAGLCIANAGVTLPHGMGMAIGGMYPRIAHGEALALVYPAFMRFTYSSAKKQFAEVGRIFNPDLKEESEEASAEKSCGAIDRFIKEIGLWINLKDKGVPESELDALAKQCMVLPDYKANPRVASQDEMKQLVRQCFSRQ